MAEVSGAQTVVRRVLFVSKRFHTNEAALVRCLVRGGVSVEYVVHEVAHSEDHSVVDPIVLGYAFGARGMSESAALKWGLYPFVTLSKVRAFDPDIVVIKGFRLASVLLCAVMRLCGRRTLLSVQRPLHGLVSRRVRWLQALTCPEVVTPVLGDPRLPSRGIGCGPLRQRWHYVPFVSEVDARACGRAYFASGRINVLLVGKFVPRKRLLEALRVCAELQTCGEEIAVTVVGTVLDDDYYGQVCALAETCENVTVMANVPHSEMSDLYLRHDVFLLASIREPAACSHLEAMAFGLATVVSSDNGTADYVQDGVSGLIFDAREYPLSLTEAMTRVVSNRSMIVAMGQAGVDRVASHHNVGPFIRLLEGLMSR